ncbi:MAG: glycosylase, partial [Anaerolineae bacterium]|nr:glycosylase [Anaerolineae bacterium]
MNHPNYPSTPAWLEDAVFYQIYPQSYYDSNGDGIGDIPGIIAKLDYLQSLGVTGCWLNPCFESPFQDAGYDVADYRKVAPRYGTNDDLKNLFFEAARRGIHILLDLVPGHTSLQHPWFIESCKPEANRYSDYYIWTDSAWKWEVPGYKVISGYADRDASFITNFFYFQPALNYGYANPDPSQPWQQSVDAPGPQAVRRELKEIMRFWLEIGASGFRVDMAFSLVKGDHGSRETAKIWKEIRTWLDAEYPEACLISECGVPSLAIPAGFHMDFCLPFGMPGYTALLRKSYGPGPGSDPYSFSFFDAIGNGNIMEFLDEYLMHYRATRGLGHIAIPTGNHDINPRLSKGRNLRDLELVFMFLMTMPGVPFIWYGDEIGMQSFDDLSSKEGGYNRTGSRTPMQWSEAPNAGFSTASNESLYLPVDPSPDRPCVEAQERDPDSILQRVKKLVAIRKAHPGLQASARFEVLYAEPGKYPFIYKRKTGSDTYIIALNPAERACSGEISYTATLSPEW